MKLSDNILMILENNGFSINEVRIQDGVYYVEINQYTPEGEDWLETIWFNGTKEGFVKSFQKHARDFDPEDAAEVWIPLRGKNGVPHSIKDLLKDAEWKKKTLLNTARQLNNKIFEESNKHFMKGENVMNIGYLKDFIKDLPDDMRVFVGCQGYSNFNFDENKPWDDTDTFAIEHDGKLFITDECAIDIGEGKYI